MSAHSSLGSPRKVVLFELVGITRNKMDRSHTCNLLKDFILHSC